ncbi:hypothetical protein J2S13_002910 [Oikeobacillus pervagus]|uniref:Uncharacterized protein n=1 Tax=Oikeobacillus pervagus TaxID=1325931 RepID=A0AAJ1WLQ3_9BACI|nr:hypothetical protein [Oikeobacillus pervagus]MDQ0216451.1 hypothetical protein [Oikeobacillus pervagus]
MDSVPVRDISWEMADRQFTIHNVPFGNQNAEVTKKLQSLRELMEADEIPSEIDFRNAADFQ